MKKQVKKIPVPTHYDQPTKSYKDGKWLVCANIAALSMGLTFTLNNVQAAETDNTVSSTQNTDTKTADSSKTTTETKPVSSVTNSEPETASNKDATVGATDNTGNTDGNKDATVGVTDNTGNTDGNKAATVGATDNTGNTDGNKAATVGATDNTNDIENTDKNPVTTDGIEVTEKATPTALSTTALDTPATTTDTEPAGDLDETYNTAKDQTDAANAAANTANQDLADLQKLLNDPDLKTTEGWQKTLQAALTKFQTSSETFSGSVETTDATVAAYQKAIDALITSKPNAVDQVTQGGDKTGNTIGDYDKLAKDYQDEVAKQIASLQNDLTKYDDATAVNTAQTELQTAAEALNTAIGAADTTVANLTDLKSAYDTALTAYNAAVTAYNDKLTTDTDDIPTIETNETNGTEDTKNPSDQAFKDLKNYLNTKETYTAANDAYDETTSKADQVTADLTAWQAAVKNYNAALKTLQDIDLSDITAADAKEIEAAKQAVQDASTATITAQKAYDAAIAADTADTSDPKDTSDLASTAKELNDKLAVLQTTVDAWNETYTAYLAAVKNKATEGITMPDLPDLGTLGQSVTNAQTALSGSTADLQTSQDKYQAALDAYQAALDANKIDKKATDGVLPDLTAFNASLQTQFTANNKTMASAEALVAVKNAERALQQKVNEINGYVTGINNTQAVWQATSDAGAETGAWNLLAKQLAAVGGQFLATGAAYKDAGANYETLVNNYLATITAYNDTVTEKDRLVASTYTKVADVTKNISDFQDSMSNFKEAYKTLMETITANAPDAEANEKAQTSLSNGTQLSTDGTPSKVVALGEIFAPQGIYMIGGSSLESIAGQPFNEDDLADGLVNFNSGMENFDTDDLGTIRKAKLIKGEDAQGNPIYMLSEADKERWMGVFRQNLLPTFVDNDKTYHLAGYFVPGTDTDATNPKQPDGYYTFTTLDPITEFFNNFLGSTLNLRTNPSFYFYYVAEPDGITKTETDEEGQTSTISAITMPTAESIADLTAVNTALALTAEGTLTAEPKVNSLANPATLTYLSGQRANTDLSKLDISQAPILTLNHVTKPTNPSGGGSTTTDPKDPTDPETPTDPEDPTDPTDPTNPETPTDPDGEDPDGNGDPNNPSDPNDPNTPDDPDDNVVHDNDTDTAPSGDTMETIYTSQKHGYSIVVNSQVSQAKTLNTLPQTGESQNRGILQSLGAALLALAAIFGAGYRKQETK